jgi:hypothetical protein
LGGDDLSVIVHINHIAPSKKAKAAGQRSPQSEMASLVTGSMMSMVEDGVLDAKLAPSLRVHLDWIQYKTNFRDPVIVRHTADASGRALPLAEIAVDLRQATAAQLPEALAKAVRSLSAPDANPERHVYLHEFQPYRDCLIWDFNRLFWSHLGDWEAASGKGFEEALPAGSSDANHPQAVADSARKFWTLCQELDTKKQLPAEITGLEIGVGTGARAASWLDAFKALNVDAGTDYYERMQFILGDYSPVSLERAHAAVSERHAGHVTGVPLDALNPFASLSQFRFKVLYVHSTNTYDNLPFDDLVRRDGKLYLVEVRAYLNGAVVDQLEAEFGITRADLPTMAKTLLAGGPFAVYAGDKGVAFWRRLWDAFKLEERLRALDDRDDGHVPPGLNRTHLDDLLAEAPDDVRFHISRGAGESFANTLPLLHPRGFLEVQDIFVSDMDDYRKGFKGPGKLDGSLVTWVNGALLRVVGARAGYDVHFAPFPYRPGTKTTVLYTTQRD